MSPARTQPPSNIYIYIYICVLYQVLPAATQQKGPYMSTTQKQKPYTLIAWARRLCWAQPRTQVVNKMLFHSHSIYFRSLPLFFFFFFKRVILGITTHTTWDIRLVSTPPTQNIFASPLLRVPACMQPCQPDTKHHVHSAKQI